MLTAPVSPRFVSHGQKAVDPLKLDGFVGPRPPGAGLPRSEGRGPIEAYYQGRVDLHPPVSHGQKAVDPLKPCCPASWSAGSGFGLPRSEGRGPIEAIPQPLRCLSGPRVSHGQKAVDPLKPVQTPNLTQEFDSLPRSEGRGPIEAGSPWCMSCSHPTCLPRSEGRGPIEARAWIADPQVTHAVSHGQKAVDPLKLPCLRCPSHAL